MNVIIVKLKNHKILTVIVITFAAFIVAGLAIIPALEIQDADAAIIKSKPKRIIPDPSLKSIIDIKLKEKLV
jgi:hypothetical protein